MPTLKAEFSGGNDNGATVHSPPATKAAQAAVGGSSYWNRAKKAVTAVVPGTAGEEKSDDYTTTPPYHDPATSAGAGVAAAAKKEREKAAAEEEVAKASLKAAAEKVAEAKKAEVAEAEAAAAEAEAAAAAAEAEVKKAEAEVKKAEEAELKARAALVKKERGRETPKKVAAAEKVAATMLAELGLRKEEQKETARTLEQAKNGLEQAKKQETNGLSAPPPLPDAAAMPYEHTVILFETSELENNNKNFTTKLKDKIISVLNERKIPKIEHINDSSIYVAFVNPTKGTMSAFGSSKHNPYQYLGITLDLTNLTRETGLKSKDIFETCSTLCRESLLSKV